METKSSQSGDTISSDLRRPRVILILILVGLLVCAGQLVHVQLIQGPELAAKAQEERSFGYKVPARRGNIVDANNIILAMDEERYDVAVNQNSVSQWVNEQYVDKEGNVVHNPKKEQLPDLTKTVLGTGSVEAARVLAPILERDPSELGGELVGDRSFVYLAKGVTPEVWRDIRKWSIPGIDSELRNIRVYPNGSTAGTILGFTDYEGVGQAGVEGTQNDKLTGTPGFGSSEIAPTGQIIPLGSSTYQAPIPGSTVHTTILADLQHHAQAVVDAQLVKVDAEWAVAVVQDIKTARILALVDSNTQDPNKPKKEEEISLGSRAVQYTYEPGSTGKVITMASALEKKTVTPLTPFEVSYQFTTPSGQTFKDSLPHPTKVLTVAGVMAESSNTGTVKIGSTVSDEDREQMMRRLGLGKLTGIEMPGETAGILSPASTWDGRQRYTTMFGQGLAVSPIQINQVVSTIANEGVLIPPRIISGWTAPNGTYTQAPSPRPEEVLDPVVAKQLITMMEGVTMEGGTARQAGIEGYRTAGKTGTTEILNPQGGNTGVVASFVGLAPAEAPRIAVSVIYYKPKNDQYGGSVAGPVFADIMDKALHALNVPPSSEPVDLYPKTP